MVQPAAVTPIIYLTQRNQYFSKVQKTNFFLLPPFRWETSPASDCGIIIPDPAHPGKSQSLNLTIVRSQSRTAHVSCMVNAF